MHNLNHRRTARAGLRFVFGCLLATTLSMLCAEGRSENWPRFRGPNGSGISIAKTVPVSWTDDDYNWKIALPGRGVSSPVVWGQRLFVTSAELEAGKRHLLCINASDGSVLWRRDFDFEKHRKHKNNTFATSTPCVDADHVYVLWQATSGSTLTALDHDGKQIWQIDLGPFRGGHGSGTSPMVYQEVVVICNDHEGASFLLAVDRATGETKWKLARSGKRACYSTPCVYRRDGKNDELIFVHSYQGITSVDPRSGDKNWDILPFGTFKQRAIASPIVAGDLVIAGSGFTTAQRNVVAVRPQASSSTAEEVYRVTRYAPHIPTPLAFDRWLFLWDDRGIVACVELTTGESVWVKRVGGSYFGSPVCVDGRLYCADRDGNVVVLAASDKYELLARNALGEPTCATPAVAGGVMYIRTDSQLFSLGGKD